MVTLMTNPERPGGVDAAELERRRVGRKLVMKLIRAAKAVKNAQDDKSRAAALLKEAAVRSQIESFNARAREAKAVHGGDTERVEVTCPTCGAQLAPTASGGLTPHYVPGQHQFCSRNLRTFKGERESRSSSVRTVSGGLPGSGRRR